VSESIKINVNSISEIEAFLLSTVDDLRLDDVEKSQMRDLMPLLSDEKISFFRNKSFALAKEWMSRQPEQTERILVWLEKVVKVIESRPQAESVNTSAHFSPGDDCLRKIQDLCHQARTSIDICVFTISDDRITDSIIKAHRRGVKVRIITDDDKSYDLGSDIEKLQQANVALVMDDSPNHMHHKFAVFDKKLLLNGSFNWTRSASTRNEENILVTDNVDLIIEYNHQFERLWKKFA